MSYDVARVRGLIPSLGDGWIHLDPQAGMQVPDIVMRAVSTGFRTTAFTPGTNRPMAIDLPPCSRMKSSPRATSCG